MMLPTSRLFRLLSLLGLLCLSVSCLNPAPAVPVVLAPLPTVAPTFTPLPTLVLPTVTPTPPASATPPPVPTATATPIPTATLTPAPVTLATMPLPTGWEPRLNHVLQVQFAAPPEWELWRTGSYGDGEIQLTLGAWDFAEVADLAQGCASIPTMDDYFQGVAQVAYRGEQVVCLIADTAGGVPNRAVVAYPAPITIASHVYDNGSFRFLSVGTTDPAALLLLLQSLDFDTTPSAPVFVRGAIDLLQVFYFFRADVDWATLEQRTLAPLTDDSPLSAAYEQINALIRELRTITNERHMFLRRPTTIANLQTGEDLQIGFIFNDEYQVTNIYPNSPAADAGILVGDYLWAVNGYDPLDSDAYNEAETVTIDVNRNGYYFSVTLNPRPISFYLPPRGRAVTAGVAYIETFGINSNRAQFEQYVSDTHTLVAQLDTPQNCGWIVDLRRNNGGTIAPIMAGLGPFVGDGELYRVRRNDEESIISYTAGLVDGRGIPRYDAFTMTPYYVRDPNVPIAILIGPGTVSAGELSAMVLRGGTDGPTRLFGRHTYGLTTTIAYVDLYDRGQLWIPVALMVGPDGQTAPQGLTPDVDVPFEYTPQFGDDYDPVVQSALGWLAAQGCE